MPLAVTNAVPTSVFPVHLYVQWARRRSFAGRSNEYPDGSAQRTALASTSRSEIPFSLRLLPAAVATFLNFYNAHLHAAFYYYDPAETSPPFTLTPTGSVGRYVARFKGTASFRSDRSFTFVDFTLVQLT